MPTIPVVCALILRGSSVLLAQRPMGKHLALKWEFPGGKVEPGESAEQAIRREIAEELGCEIAVVAALPRSLHEYERGTVEMIPFICHLLEHSAPPVAREHEALAWVERDNLEQYDLAAADWPVVQAWRSVPLGDSPSTAAATAARL